MQLQKHKNTLIKIGAILAGAALGFAALPLGLPFLLGWLLALGAERAVRFLGERTSLPRWARSGICVTALFAVLGAVLYFFVRVLWEELVRLVGQLPELLGRLRPVLDQMRTVLEGWAAKAPGSLSRALIRWIEELFAGGSVLLDSLYGFLSGLVSRVVTGLPGLLLTLVTTLIATYMTSAALPEIKAWLKKHLPRERQNQLRTLRGKCRSAFGGWVKAQMKVMLIVFCVLTVGLWMLRVEFALLFGGLIAILDALPVLGTGTVLIPWALVCFLQGQTGRGVGLLVLYGAVSLTRSIMEPRLVGRQLGLHPLVSLMAFYVGYRLFGVAGMILLPLLAVVVRQFFGPHTVEEPMKNGE